MCVCAPVYVHVCVCVKCKEPHTIDRRGGAPDIRAGVDEILGQWEEMKSNIQGDGLALTSKGGPPYPLRAWGGGKGSTKNSHNVVSVS